VPFKFERIPPELRLLIHCVRHYLNPETPVDRKKNLDWDLVVAAARWHRVHPFLLRHSGGDIPEDQRKKLMELSKDQARQSLVMLASMNRLISQLQNHQIPVLQMKGLSLAQLAYGDLSVRSSVDLDFLLRPQDAEKAITLLQEQLHFKHYEAMSKTHLRLRTRVDCEEALTDGLISLDIHWACSLFPEMFPLNLDGVIKQPFNVDLGQVSAPTLPLPHLISYLCFHGAKHQWAKLFWISDIAALVLRRSDIHWGDVVHVAGELRQTRSLAQGLMLAHFLFQSPIPKPVEEIIGRDPEVLALVHDTLVHLFDRDHNKDHYEIEVSLAEKVRWELRLYPQRSTRLAILMRYIFQPGSSDIRAVSLPHFLFPLYYLVRPLRLIFREFMKKTRA